MFKTINHYNSCFADKEVEWISSDSEELYNEHLVKNKGALEMFGWVDYKKFTYKFNSHGFRCEEFNDQESIMFLGCSHTFGTGNPEENIWPTIVAQSLGLRSVNLGISSSSNDTAFRLGHHYIPQLKPKIVIWLSTDISRLELHTLDERVEAHGPWTEDGGYFLSNWLANPVNSEINFTKNYLALESVCKSNNIKFLERSIYQIRHADEKDMGRDLMHFGKLCHNACAQGLLELL